MINQKAPRDMTAPEKEAVRSFLDYAFSGFEFYDEHMTVEEFFHKLDKMLAEPAPNPFTEDQLAAMRECQRGGWNYAGKDTIGTYLYRTKPHRSEFNNWFDDENDAMESHLKFVDDALSVYDPEPLCFADYAPLKGKE